MRARFVVERCDNMGTLEPDRKNLTWAVVDKWHDRACVLDSDSRTIARCTAREYNAIQCFASALAQLGQP